MSRSSTAISERIQYYILDGYQEDLRRLLRIPQITGNAARTAISQRRRPRRVNCDRLRPRAYR
jgi:predicted DNA-binding helix-hairpin-helix protein